jgi:hypothetical protein
LRHTILNPDEIGFVVALDVADADITERKAPASIAFWADRIEAVSNC